MPAITVEEAIKSKQDIIPEAVFDVINRLIVQKMDSNYSSRVTHDEIVNEVSRALNLSRQEIFERHYLDVEDSYRAVGWSVEYDKPAYNESYGAYFIFKLKDTKRG
jgi:hypothetical protein